MALLSSVDESTFTELSKRFHQKLKQQCGLTLPLGQFRELMVQAVGHRSLHDARKSWAHTPIQAPSSLSTSPETINVIGNTTGIREGLKASAHTAFGLKSGAAASDAHIPEQPNLLFWEEIGVAEPGTRDNPPPRTPTATVEAPKPWRDALQAFKEGTLIAWAQAHPAVMDTLRWFLTTPDQFLSIGDYLLKQGPRGQETYRALADQGLLTPTAEHSRRYGMRLMHESLEDTHADQAMINWFMENLSDDAIDSALASIVQLNQGEWLLNGGRFAVFRTVVEFVLASHFSVTKKAIFHPVVIARTRRIRSAIHGYHTSQKWSKQTTATLIELAQRWGRVQELLNYLNLENDHELDAEFLSSMISGCVEHSLRTKDYSLLAHSIRLLTQSRFAGNGICRIAMNHIIKSDVEMVVEQTTPEEHAKSRERTATIQMGLLEQLLKANRVSGFSEAAKALNPGLLYFYQRPGELFDSPLHNQWLLWAVKQSHWSPEEKEAVWAGLLPHGSSECSQQRRRQLLADTFRNLVDEAKATPQGATNALPDSSAGQAFLTQVETLVGQGLDLNQGSRSLPSLFGPWLFDTSFSLAWVKAMLALGLRLDLPLVRTPAGPMQPLLAAMAHGQLAALNHPQAWLELGAPPLKGNPGTPTVLQQLLQASRGIDIHGFAQLHGLTEPADLAPLWVAPRNVSQLNDLLELSPQGPTPNDVAQWFKYAQTTPSAMSAGDRQRLAEDLMGMLNWAIERGLNVRAPLNEEGETLLHWAAKHLAASDLYFQSRQAYPCQPWQFLQRLLEAGADVNAKTTTGEKARDWLPTAQKRTSEPCLVFLQEQEMLAAMQAG